jgi:outer membrane protein assembly factor BamE (lipoprotein component of BamABCDE complex)
MTMTRRFAAILLLLLACAGFTTSGAAVGGELGLSEFSKVVVGKSTKADVLALLGAPSRAGQLRTEERETWEYKYGGGRSFWVEFGSDGIVALTNVTVDFNSSRYGGP